MTQKQDVKLGYYKAEIDSLFFNMTPTLYKVVMGVINTLNKTGTEKKQIEEENKEKVNENAILLKWSKSVVVEIMKQLTEELKIHLI